MTRKEKPSTEPEPTAFNPFFLEGDKFSEYMEHYLGELMHTPDGTGFKLYRGSKEFLEFVKKREIGVGTTIRVTYGGYSHHFYVLTTKGFVDNLNPSRGILPLKKILDDKDETGRPVQWFFEDHDLIGSEEDLLEQTDESVGTEGFGPPTSSM